ncbi:cytochrome C oxidase subunit IV family protein [Mycolicibacterium elephantis]|uniref:Prokaryotic cytochrome C oxidase subunit IV family protein n=1 Tax=Mycolicibacterium elephantis DSM 44368 TaxID=1335622 RepID=A0A439DRL0_9MYCO|nr:cytochrome C oxidase subunit IV family protein [Mycolicibacterium elephantis]MCV7221731.1 cytochrome C oxidase subunit IV family protein [Mycolicibacterium elephantis]RWA18785.1 hypothetical protein MELE44368_03895 [Mycolicibacterium elephantis DSM 44368]
MTADKRWVGVVYGVLVVLTVGALAFTSGTVHEILSPRVAAAGAAALAFVKAWLVAMDFMELRGTALRRWAGAWFLVVGLLCIVLILR